MISTLVLVLAVLTLTLFGATFQAWRARNERRDVALLAAIGGALGLGTAVAAI